MDVDPDRQMESCSSAASSSAAFDDECKTSTSCEEFAYPEPIRRDKELQEEKEELGGGGQESMDVDPNRQIESCTSAASSNAAFDEQCKASNSCEEEPTRHDEELQEKQEQIEALTAAIQEKLVVNGEMPKLLDEAQKVLFKTRFNLLVVSKCRECILKYGKGVSLNQLSDYCKEQCLQQIPRCVKDHLLKKVEESTQKGVKKSKKVKKQKQVKEPNEVMQSEEVEQPKEDEKVKQIKEVKKGRVKKRKQVKEPNEVMQSEEVEEPKEVTQSEEVEKPKEDEKVKKIKKVRKGEVKKRKQVKEPNEVMQSEEVEEPKEVMQSEEVEQPKEDEKIKKVRKGKVKKRK